MRSLLLLIALAAFAAATSFDHDYLTPKQRYMRLLRSGRGVYDGQQSDLFGGLHDLLRYEYADDADEQDEFGRRVDYSDEMDPDEMTTFDYESRRHGGQCHRGHRRHQDDYERDLYERRRHHQGRFPIDFEDEQYDDIDTLPYERRYDQQYQQPRDVCRPKYHLLPEIEESNSHLATNLYRQAKQENDDKNVVVSPAAVHLGLAALTQASRGNTRRQLAVVTGGRLSDRERHNAFTALNRLFRSNNVHNVDQTEQDDEFVGRHNDQYEMTPIRRARINTVTAIFLSQTTPAQRRFIETVQRCLGVRVSRCDFEHRPQQCRQQINRYVSERTRHQINNIVPTEAVTDNTKMLLVNSLHVKANFARQFRERSTVTVGKFLPLDAQRPKPVQMIRSRATLNYHERDNLKVVGIPTENRELSLYVILPKEKKGLSDLETENPMDGQKLKLLLDNCDRRTERVDLHLPKFQIKHKIDIRRTLINQGITDLFDVRRADFTPITGVRPGDYDVNNVNVNNDEEQQQQQSTNVKTLHLNKFLHQATIKVTPVGISSTVGRQDDYQHQQQQDEYDMDDVYYGQYQQHHQQQPFSYRETFEEMIGGESTGRKLVKCDHPFAFVVRHRQTKQVLLIGRVIDAAQKIDSNVQPIDDSIEQQQQRVHF